MGTCDELDIYRADTREDFSIPDDPCHLRALQGISDPEKGICDEDETFEEIMLAMGLAIGIRPEHKCMLRFEKSGSLHTENDLENIKNTSIESSS